MFKTFSLLAGAIDRLTEATETQLEWLKSHLDCATVQDLKNMERRIMSVISDYLVKQTSFNQRQEAAHTTLEKSLTGPGGLTEDIAELNRIITELQNSSGGVTPEDQALITEAETKGEAVTAKLEAFSTALEALNAQTPPKAPPVP